MHTKKSKIPVFFTLIGLAIACGTPLDAALQSNASITVGNEGYSVGGFYQTNDARLVDPGRYFRYFQGQDAAGDYAVSSFEAFAKAKSGYGILNTYASATVTNALNNPNNEPYYDPETSNTNPEGVPDTFRASAGAFFGDRITFADTVTPAFIQFDITISASLLSEGINFQDPFGSNYARLFLRQWPAETFTTPTAWLFDEIIRSPGENMDDFSITVTSAPIPVVNGVATFGFQLNSEISFSSVTEDGVTRFGHSDAFHTAVLSGVRGYSESGEVVEGFEFLGASGTDYAAIPEPATYAAILAFGAVGMTAYLKRRRRLAPVSV